MKFFLLSMLLIFIAGLSGIFYLNQILNPPKLTYLELGPVTISPISLTLALSSPDDNLLVFSPDLLIQGKTLPNSSVLISTEMQDQVIKATASGDFSQTWSLDEGVTNFTVVSFDDHGNSKTENRTVYYSKEKL